MYLVLSQYITGFNAANVCGTDGDCERTGVNFLRFYTLYNYYIVIFMVTGIIAIGLTSFKLAADTAFFILSFILAPVLGFISYLFNFVFAQVVSNVAYDTVRGIFPRTILICTNLHWVALVAFAVGSITLFAKKREGQYV